MIAEAVKELAAAKAKVAELEAALQNEMRGKLAGLPAELGFDDLPSFIKALKAAAGAHTGRPRAAARPSASGRGAKRGKRTRITPEMKEEVKTMVQAGKTGVAIAKAVGISLPSVQNIKKAFGLTRKR